MAATKYTYSISGDFPNQKVNPSELWKEVEASSITTALEQINTNGDNCDIWFVDPLSGAEQTTLDGVVAAHQGTDTVGHQIRRREGNNKTESAGTWTTMKDYTTPELMAGWWYNSSQELYNFKYSDGAYYIRSGSVILPLTVTPVFYDLDYAIGDAGKTAYIKEAFIMARKI